MTRDLHTERHASVASETAAITERSAKVGEHARGHETEKKQLLFQSSFSCHADCATAGGK